MREANRDAASFRDPSGFIFHRDGALFRQVNESYREHYDLLMQSGLYKSLVREGVLIRHEESEVPPAEQSTAYKVLQPELVPFISYPYEWSFSQLQNAAVTTLKIQQRAMEHGMILKDASAYNIQFHNGRAVFIDTLSFERYEEGMIWPAYRQFCQHFLAPLLLIVHRDVRLQRLLRDFIDGVPLDLAAGLLPFKTKFSFGAGAHIHAHARWQTSHGGTVIDREAARLPRARLEAIVAQLLDCIENLTWKKPKTEWGDYYDATNYSKEDFEKKKETVRKWCELHSPKTVWDFGSNNGEFSRIAAEAGAFVVSIDGDPVAVEENYKTVRKRGENILPLCMDLSNPSPGLGWMEQERKSLSDRGPAEMGLALALVHHLAIGANIPLELIAEWFAENTRRLIVEFVPKSDSQVERLLANRDDIFDRYSADGFVEAFERFFTIEDRVEVSASGRILFLMKRRPNE